jgi:menaquinol-cytochrome c reductase iron-sulfur subunit
MGTQGGSDAGAARGFLEARRREFLALAVAVLGALIALLLAIPFLGACVGPSFRRIRRRFARVGKVAGLSVGQPAQLGYTDRKLDAYLAQTVTRHVWAVKGADGGVTVFSPICPHLGCRYEWVPAAKHFYCPCHHSVFAVDGAVLGGPAPRPLDTLPSRVEKGELEVEWERYEPGIPEKKVV